MMIKDAKILIRELFSEQYTLTIQSEVNAVDVFVTSTVQLRYDFHVLRIDHQHVEVRLIQLDNIVLEANNPMVKEVAQISQVFGRMYNELHLLLDHSGKLIDVLNAPFILSKWKQTKAEMDNHIAGNDDLKNAIILNDALFTDPEKIKIAVEANEFLRIYFGQIYNKELPETKKIPGTNIFNTQNMEWRLNIGSSVPLPAAAGVQSLTITTTAEPATAINGSFIRSAYAQFTNKIDFKELRPILSQHETRIISYQSGKLQEAAVQKSEIVAENKLYNQLIYTLKSDSGIIFNNRDIEEQSTETQGTTEKESSNKFRFF